MVDQLFNLLNHTFYTHLYYSIFLLVFIEEMGIPLPIFPGDVYVFLAGAQIAQNKATVIPLVLLLVLASTCGSSVLFAVTYFGGHKLVLKFGKYVGITHTRLEKAQRLFLKHGTRTILFGRLIYGLRTVCTVVSGIFQLKYWRFASATAVSTMFWALFYLYLGIKFGSNYHTLLHKLTDFAKIIFPNQYYIYLLILLIGIAFFLTRWSIKNSNNKEVPTQNNNA